MRSFLPFIASSLTLVNCACTMSNPDPTAASEPTPAIADPAPSNISALTTALATALGRANVELGIDNATRSPAVSVLPTRLSPLETHSKALPETFDLQLAEGVCQAVNRSSGAVVALPDVRCAPYMPADD